MLREIIPLSYCPREETVHVGICSDMCKIVGLMMMNSCVCGNRSGIFRAKRLLIDLYSKVRRILLRQCCNVGQLRDFVAWW